MRSSRLGAIPSEIGDLVDELDDLQRRVATLEAPSGESLAQTVAKLKQLVENLETRLDDYIATGLPDLVDAAVAAALTAALAGNVAVGGNLTVGGTATVAGAVTLPNVPTKTFSAEPRTVVWVDTSNGRIGRT